MRVIIDIGMQLELPIPAGQSFHPGATWTPEHGLQFLREHGHIPDAWAASEVDRYLGLPGQAISYKVGERAWLQARDAVRRRQGTTFDLKDFHARALNLGPLELAQLQEELARV